MQGQENGFLTVSEGSSDAQHLLTMLDTDILDDLTNAMMHHSWTLSVPPEGRSFWTSDHPIALKSHVYDPILSTKGYASPGIEIWFPLTSRLGITMLERDYHKPNVGIEDKHVGLNRAQWLAKNRLQVESSARWVYGLTDDFKVADDLCALRPNLRDPKRIQASVSLDQVIMPDGSTKQLIRYEKK